MRESVKGALYTALAYIWWGFLPFYWRFLTNQSAYEIICFRAICSAVFLFIILVITKQSYKITEIIKNKKSVMLLFASGALVLVNWLLSVWGANNGHVLDLGLGQFITPLISVLFGRIFFHEDMSLRQYAAVVIAFSALALQLFLVGKLPVISIGLTLTFSLYGIVKKCVKADSCASVFFETLLMSPFAILFMIYMKHTGVSHFPYASTAINLLLFGTGAVASIPYLFFTSGVKRCRLTTFGFIQYIGPVSFFILGAFVWHEPLDKYKMTTFCLIWIAVVLYLVDAVMKERKAARSSS